MSIKIFVTPKHLQDLDREILEDMHREFGYNVLDSSDFLLQGRVSDKLLSLAQQPIVFPDKTLMVIVNAEAHFNNLRMTKIQRMNCFFMMSVRKMNLNIILVTSDYNRIDKRVLRMVDQVV